jgi:hypothetical protein
MYFVLGLRCLMAAVLWSCKSDVHIPHLPIHPPTHPLTHRARYGDVTPHTTAEVVFTIVYVAFNIVVWAYVLGTITLLVTKQVRADGVWLAVSCGYHHSAGRNIVVSAEDQA